MAVGLNDGVAKGDRDHCVPPIIIKKAPDDLCVGQELNRRLDMAKPTIEPISIRTASLAFMATPVGMLEGVLILTF